ncbi:MAG: RNA methyltransferase, partial [Clostridiales bacterium]|nr:RNA methyltransferase [Clostridiales bacterium]
SMTGILSVRFHYAQDLQDVKAAGFTVVAAALGGEDIFSAPVSAQKVCLVIGNEADGIDEALQKTCDCAVTIPMESGMESLNAAVSAGILMYTIRHRKK